MSASLAAGAAYFAVVFALGFAPGTVRVLVLAPALGEGASVLVELPVMLAAAWFVCRWLVQRFRVPSAWTDRLAMGGVAFALLLMAELGVSVLLFGRSPGGHLETYRTWSAILGLAGQLAFAAMPLVQLRSGYAIR